MAFKTLDHSDITLFKNRLWKLMETKKIETSKALAKKLYDNGYVSVSQKESFDEPNIIYQRAIDSVDKKIQFHLKSDGAEKLQGEFVLAYCKFFECSADYLFGKIECKNHDLQFICKHTGLSEKAIQILQKMKRSQFGRRLLASLEILVLDVEKFSGDKYYKRFLELFSDYLQFSGNDKRYLFSKNGEIKEEKPTHDEYGNRKFDKDRVTITSDSLKYIFLMEITDTLKRLKKEYDKNPHFLD